MPFDPYKNVESVFDEVSARSVSLWRTVMTHPRQAIAGAAAAIVAPLVFKTDERGYVQTSLVTTPLVAAGTVAAPRLFRSATDIGARLINYTRNQVARRAGVTSWEDLQSMRTSLNRGAIFQSQFEKHAREYVSSRPAASTEDVSKNLARQVRSMRTQFRRYLGSEKNSALLANAVFAEGYRSMGAEELASFGHRSLPPEWSWRDMWRFSSKRLGNEKFVRGMNFRLQQMGKLRDQGGSFLGEDLRKLGRRDEFGPIDATSLRTRTYGQSTLFDNLLRRDRPELAEEIDRAVSDMKFGSKDRLELLGVGRGAEVERIAGLRVFRQGYRPLDIFVPQADGSIVMGDQFNRKGVSRNVLNLETQELLPADIFAIRNIGDLEDVRGTLNKAQFGGYLDRAEDTFQHFADGENFAYQLNPFTTKARSNQVLLHGLGKLGPKDREEAILDAMKQHNLIKTWSEGSFAKGVLEAEELSQVSPGGVYDPSKQSRQLRGIKPIMASEALDQVTFSGFHAPFSRTNYWEKILPGNTVPEFGTRIGGVSPHIKSLIGDLPGRKKFLFDKGTKEMALSAIMKDLRDAGQEPTLGQAEKIWGKMREFLRTGSNLRNVKKLGYLGEGDHLLIGQNLPMVVSPKTYYVHQVRLKDLTGMVSGKSEFGSDLLLGFNNGTAITASGKRNILQGFNVLEDGRVALHVVEGHYASTGKTDAHTKGLNIGTHKGESDTIRNFMNTYGAESGTGTFIPGDVEMLALHHYSHNKANVGEQTLNIGADLFRRLESSGELGAVGPHQQALANLGFSYGGGTLTEDVEAFRQLSYEARARRLQEAVDVVNQMMADVGERIKTSQMRGDDFLAHYKNTGSGSLIDYVHRNASPVNVMFWNTVEQNVPESAAITYDMLGHLHLRGYQGTVKELLSNSRIDGDIGMTEQVMSYLDRGDFSTPLGPALTPGEAVPGYTGNVQLNAVDERANTIFDPAHPVASKNFSLKLSDGTHVPVLGHDAYGGKINRYGSGRIATNERESLLASVMRADFSGKGLEEAKAAYTAELQRFGYGKEGFLRARRVDPHGLTGFVQTAPSTLGPGNPFEVAIGSDMFSQIRDANIRSSLEAGEDVYAAIARHPVSHVPLVRVRLDRRLNPNIVGIDEGLRGLLMADDDGDIINTFFLDKSSDAWKEAHAAVTDPSSLQHKELRIQRALEGLEDDSRLATDTAFRSLAGREVGLGEKSIEGIMRARTAGGSVGQFSNVLTGLMLGLESNNRITNPENRAALQRVFWAIRQAPIAAQKSKAANISGLDDALRMANRLSMGVNNRTDRGFDLFYQSLLELGGSFGKTVDWHKDMEDIGLSAEMAVEGKINPLLKYIENNQDAFREYHQGVNPGVSEATRMLVSNGGPEGKILAGLDDGLLNYLKPPLKEVKRTGATMAAETLGTINEGIIHAAREVKSVAGSPEIGGILAAGLGIAALAGLASTSLGKPAGTAPGFSERNANAYRPENVHGASDHVPGEPVEGSMAPSRPPRRMVQARPGVRTSYVAPVNQTVNLEVKARATDRSALAEQAKLLARMSTDGDSNITVNVRQGLRTRSLRMREKVREMRSR